MDDVGNSVCLQVCLCVCVCVDHLLCLCVFNCPNKQSDSDPIPTWLLKVCTPVLTPTITNIVNLSLSSGQFHPILKESIISPLLKKPTLDKDQLFNYWPISNLSLISKIIERVVKCRLTNHLVSNGHWTTVANLCRLVRGRSSFITQNVIRLLPVLADILSAAYYT